MKNLILYLFLLGSFAFIFTSCKKDDVSNNNNSARETLIVGTFKLNATGEDINNNNLLDPGENDLIPVGASLVEVFRADKTGTVYTTIPGGMKDTTEFTYAFQNDFTQINVTTGTTSAVTQILVLNNTVLSGYDVSTSPHRIYAFVRQ